MFPTFSPIPRRHPRRRAGASIIEVLFSMGIVAVGLLGVLAIFPVAGSRMSQGTIADMSDRVGRNAFRQFEVMQMGRPSTWKAYSGTPLADGDSFCIDPLLIADYFGTSSWNANVPWFPYYASLPTPAPPRMQRISLCNYPGSTTGMNASAADAVFRAQDDLAFSLPADRTLPPVQNFGNNQRRQSEGKYSWIATVCPKAGSVTDEYVLSVVVFLRRAIDPGEEIRLQCTAVQGVGYNGGDVTLRTTNGSDEVQMRAGEWLLLSAIDPTTTVKVFRWYRIQAADTPPPVKKTGTFDREITLLGQDWPYAANITYVTWIPGAVAVYEKTFRKEMSSLWTES